MTLEILQKEMVAAMKAKDKLRKETISSLIGLIKKTAIDEKCKDNITEELVNRVILKEKKTVQDMIDTCPPDRIDLIETYTNRMGVIEEFVPKMMSEEEIKEEIVDILSYEDVDNNVGAIMRVVMPKLKGKADGKLINKVVSEIVKAG